MSTEERAIKNDFFTPEFSAFLDTLDTFKKYTILKSFFIIHMRHKTKRTQW